MVAFHDLRRVTHIQGLRRHANDLEVQIHAHGKIRAVEKSRSTLLHQVLHVVQLAIPTGRADDHARSGARAGRDVFQHRRRRGEVDHAIHATQLFFRQRAGICIFLIVQRQNRVAALPRDLHHQRTGLPAPQQHKVHRFSVSPNISGSASVKKQVSSFWIGSGTSASSITKLMLISEAPCEIMRTLIPETAPKTFAAMPCVPRIFSPTRQTIALRPSYFTSARLRRSAAIAGIASFESTVTETLTSEVGTISTGHLCRANTSKMEARNPCAISMRVATMSTMVIRFLAAMALKVLRLGGMRAVMRVPSFFGLREFSTSTGMFFCTAGSSVAGCNTLAPK